MANDDEDDAPARSRCGACFGEGGSWEDRNGNSGGQSVWVSCRACGGSGWQ